VRWCFGEFAIDLDTRQLTRGTRDIHLSPKAFDLLADLIAHQPKVMMKAELVEHLWPGTFVLEANLANLIVEIRAALKDRARAPKFVRTAHGAGYAFCGEATRDAASARVSARTSCWIQWGKHRYPLASGQHVIGRDADADVRIESSTVSRRHARLTVSVDQTVLEDFGSKNGTYLRDQRVTTPTGLSDGDDIRIGSLLITYHARKTDTSTDSYAWRKR
jgi:DNA-binding winged helix-turn-helix (wHTH) protein